MDRPEYAFIGRSNVGKSSLINKLVNRKDLAKTSGTPGKTQLINHFVIHPSSPKESWYLVDLPGFGYAKVSKTNRTKWARTTEQFLQGRKNLVCVMMLVDSRHPPQKIDLEFMAWMGENSLPFVLVFTKLDKLNQAERAAFMPRYEAEMLKQWHRMPPVFCTSGTHGEGREELLQFIATTNETVEF
jgi:GTP-binding protein